MRNMFTQAIGYGRALHNYLHRASGYLPAIPALLVFPNIWGLLGIQTAQPVADICTLAPCIAIANGILRRAQSERRFGITTALLKQSGSLDREKPLFSLLHRHIPASVLSVASAPSMWLRS